MIERQFSRFFICTRESLREIRTHQAMIDSFIGKNLDLFDFPI